MSLTPSAPRWYTSPFVSTYSPEGHLGFIGSVHEGMGSALASANYPAANRAYYHPIYIPAPCTIYRFFWLNGATATTNNLQVGVYYDDTDGPGDSYLLGTSTTASGANVCQFDNVTDTAISPGHWWLAIWSSGTSNTTLMRAVPGASTGGRRIGGYLQSSLVSGLPANATAAQNTTAFIPLYGFTTVASP